MFGRRSAVPLRERATAILCALVLIVASSVAALTHPRATSAAAARDTPSQFEARPPAGVDDLAWLAGEWQGTREGIQIEEVWLPPRGGLMLGLHRETNLARNRATFEFLRIESRPEGLVYVALPGGRNSTDFRLGHLEAHRVSFENPQHDFPKRVAYWLDEEGALNARVDGGSDDDPNAQQWRWTPSLPQ